MVSYSRTTDPPPEPRLDPRPEPARPVSQPRPAPVDQHTRRLLARRGRPCLMPGHRWSRSTACSVRGLTAPSWPSTRHVVNISLKVHAAQRPWCRRTQQNEGDSMSKKTTTGTIAIPAGVVLLLAGAGTYALWEVNAP